MPLPTFFVVGAQKAGTSSLYAYLAQHPQVFMSPVKEPGFFKVGDQDVEPSAETPVTRMDDYLRLFDGVHDETAIGEASTAYLVNPTVPANIRAVVPDARLIAVLRNPADRAFSAYNMLVAEGRESRSFADALAPEIDPSVGGKGSWKYLLPGYYARHLTRWLEVFDAGQLQVHLYEDLSARTGAVVQELFEFVGVDSSFVPDLSPRHVTQYAPRSVSLHRTMRAAGRAVARVLPASSYVRVGDAVKRRTRRVPDFPLDLRHTLVDIYRDDIVRTGELIGRDLSAWTSV